MKSELILIQNNNYMVTKTSQKIYLYIETVFNNHNGVYYPMAPITISFHPSSFIKLRNEIPPLDNRLELTLITGLKLQPKDSNRKWKKIRILRWKKIKSKDEREEVEMSQTSILKEEVEMSKTVTMKRGVITRIINRYGHVPICRKCDSPIKEGDRYKYLPHRNPETASICLSCYQNSLH